MQVIWHSPLVNMVLSKPRLIYVILRFGCSQMHSPLGVKQ